MISNDISNKLRLRFKRSKDFNKLIEKLKKEGYKIEKTLIKNKRYVKVSKNDKQLLYMVYEDIEDFKGKKGYEYLEDTKNEYKQNIIAIYY